LHRKVNETAAFGGNFLSFDFWFKIAALLFDHSFLRHSLEYGVFFVSFFGLLDDAVLDLVLGNADRDRDRTRRKMTSFTGTSAQLTTTVIGVGQAD
jgi:hypothetical protein